MGAGGRHRAVARTGASAHAARFPGEDGSRHARRPAAVRPDRHHGRRHERSMAFFVEEEGTMSSFRRFPGDRGAGLFCSLYADRALWHTPDAGGKVDKDSRPRGRASAPRHRAHRSLFGRGQGAVRAHVRHLAEAPAAGLRLAGITGIDEATASSRRSICPNTTPASPPRPRTRAPPSSPSPARSTTSCASTRTAPSLTTTPCATSAWHFDPRRTAATTSGHAGARPTARRRLPGPRCLARSRPGRAHRHLNPAGRVDAKSPWTSGQPLRA